MSTVRRAPGDRGFTLLETVVAIAVISIVMASVTAFFTTTGTVTRRQHGTYTAARIAADAISQVRSIKGSALTAGRDRTSAESQWAAAVPAVAGYLADSVPTWDTEAAAGTGPTAALPTEARTVPVDGVPYRQSWYVGRCWLRPNGSCGNTSGTGDIPMYRVVVAVTWTDHVCGATCAYASSTLASSESAEPAFNVN